MEGVSHEACSLAGTWGLGKLIVLYDSNGISIDGKIDAWFSEDVGARFRAYRWQIIGPIDGHDSEALDKALAEARADLSRPSLIICHTHIGLRLAQGRFRRQPRFAAGRKRLGRHAPGLGLARAAL